jgi:O-antigen/teichoic acid export membrane protein
MAVTNLALNLLLTPTAGLGGAALATVIGFAVSLLLSARVGVKKDLLKNIYLDIIKCATCVFITIMFSYLIDRKIGVDGFHLEWQKVVFKVTGNIFTFCLLAFLLNIANIRCFLDVMNRKSIAPKHSFLTKKFKI